MFSCHFYNGKQLCDFLFGSLNNEIFPNGKNFPNELSPSFFPLCLTYTDKGGKNENGRAVSSHCKMCRLCNSKS